MSEVKVTIEWKAETDGLHPDPMKVHMTAKADPNKIIGAVWEAMDEVERVYRLDPITKRCVNVILPYACSNPSPVRKME